MGAEKDARVARMILVVVVSSFLVGRMASQSNWPPETNADIKAAAQACIAISLDGNCPGYTCAPARSLHPFPPLGSA